MSVALPSDYQQRSSAEKLELLWSRVVVDPHDLGAPPTAIPGPWGRRKLFSVGHNRVSFEHASDELPPERAKLVHNYGSVAKVRLHIDEDSPYTGIFCHGGAGLLRASDATGGGKFTPSLAIKFLVDGKPSLNLLALPTVLRDPGDHDFLSGAFSNATPAPKTLDAKLVVHAFERTARSLKGTRLHGVYLPLHHLAQTGPDGEEVAESQVPDRVELHSSEAARSAQDRSGEWRQALASLPDDVVLFEFRAARTIDTPAIRIGELRLESSFVASRYGDERLFFQHDVGPTS